MNSDLIVRPFAICIDDSELIDLRNRLIRTRWPQPESSPDWQQGVPLAWLQELCSQWRDDYDWRDLESRINAWPNVLTCIDGVDIHAIHARSRHEQATPLVLTHGWPGSVIEFLQVLGPLTDPTSHGGQPEDAFHVVCPSLPGFGFSGVPEEPGWAVSRIASAWVELMSRLGYPKFLAQGGDWGGLVTLALASNHPDHLFGVHLNGVTMPLNPGDNHDLTEFEVEALDSFADFLASGMGYVGLQSTRPQTLGFGLADSPAGQAAWIAEKYWSWCDHADSLEEVISRTTLLDTITLYWLTNTGATSARIYWEQRALSQAAPVAVPSIGVPSGVSVYPGEIRRHSRRWIEAGFSDLRFFATPERGGHFPALEQPRLFVEQVRDAARAMRRSKT